MFRLAIWILITSGLLAVGLPAGAAQVPALSQASGDYRSSRKNVLILVSAHKTDTWSEAIADGVEDVFAASADIIGIWTEYMDASRFTDSNAERVLIGLYRRKYMGLKFDVIVTIGAPAVKFALAHHQDLFQGSPIVFSGLDAGQSAGALKAGAVIGVSEAFRYRKTLDAAFRLLPDTRKIIFISPDLKNLQIAYLLLPEYRPEIELEIWHDPELAEILQRASRVASDSILLPLAEPGRSPQYSKPRDSFMAALTAASPAPVFSVWDVALGHGILGGYLTPGQYQGVMAGRFALDLMHGKSLAGIPPAEVRANRLTVDRDAMKRFNVDSARLPETVRLHPPNLEPWRWLRRYFQQIAMLFFFFAAISAILLYLLYSRQKAQAARAISEARFRAVFEHLPMSMTLRDLQGRFLLVNQTFADRYNVDQTSVRGQYGYQIFGAEFDTVLREQEREVLERKTAVEREHILKGESGKEGKTLLVVKFPIPDADGTIQAVGSCAIDTSERTRTMEALVKSEIRFQSLYDNAPDIYFTLGRNGKIAAVNKYGAHYLGYDKVDLEGTSILDLIHPSDQIEVRDNLARLEQDFSTNYERKFEFRLVRNDAMYIWVNMRVHMVSDGLDEDPALWAICRDISAAHQLSEELSYQASHDALTGLVNRREFEQRLKRAVEHLHDSHAQHALCFLDLDQFKIINDTCGHMAGDDLLRQLGTVLKQRLRGRDIVARVGGDEFAILMEHCPLQQACRIAEQIRADVEKHRFNFQQQVFSIGVSIGIAAINIDSGTAEDVLKDADSACYFAKDQGRNRVHVFTRDSIEVARHHGEVRWVTRLQQALVEDKFELWHQPIVPIAPKGKAAKQHMRAYFEILLRLRDSDNNLSVPGVFMPSAERFGLCGRIDRWVLCHVLDWLAANPGWMDRYAACFINLSASSFADESFLDFVIEQLRQSAVPGHQICFEITETTVISNYAQAANFISTLKPRGCRFALDDFGSGVSSFMHLKRLDVDFLKIDGQIVRDIARDPVNLAMVQSIQHVGTIMNKITIAESIEDPQVLDILTGLGVSYGQGYHLGSPSALDGIVEIPADKSTPDAVSAGEGEQGVGA